MLQTLPPLAFLGILVGRGRRIEEESSVDEGVVEGEFEGRTDEDGGEEEAETEEGVKAWDFG